MNVKTEQTIQCADMHFNGTTWSQSPPCARTIHAHNEVVQKGEPLQTVSTCALEHVGSSIHRKMVGVVGQVG